MWTLIQEIFCIYTYSGVDRKCFWRGKDGNFPTNVFQLRILKLTEWRAQCYLYLVTSESLSILDKLLLRFVCELSCMTEVWKENLKYHYQYTHTSRIKFCFIFSARLEIFRQTGYLNVRQIVDIKYEQKRVQNISLMLYLFNSIECYYL